MVGMLSPECELVYKVDAFQCVVVGIFILGVYMPQKKERSKNNEGNQRLEGMPVKKAVKLIEECIEFIHDACQTNHYKLSYDISSENNEHIIEIDHREGVYYHPAMVTPALPLKLKLEVTGQVVHACRADFFSPLTSTVTEGTGENKHTYFHPLPNVILETKAELVDFMLLHLSLSLRCMKALDPYFIQALKTMFPEDAIDKQLSMMYHKDPKTHTAVLAISTLIKPHKKVMVLSMPDLTLQILKQDTSISPEHTSTHTQTHLAPMAALSTSFQDALVRHRGSSSSSLSLSGRHAELVKAIPQHFAKEDPARYLQHSFLRGSGILENHPLIEEIMQIVLSFLFFEPSPQEKNSLEKTFARLTAK